MTPPKSVVFVCLGNICRSPTLEAIARAEFARSGLAIEVASAGTHDYHVGQGADPRSVAAAALHGYSLATHRARQLDAADFGRFEVILAMDAVNLRAIERVRPQRATAQVALFSAWTGIDADEVPDPYYGESDGFERVIELARLGIAAAGKRFRGGARNGPGGA
jgi:protein-tyrosine phosphatase